ncbi:nitroreductase/quinone reductase family protein [Spelaeicoccus albus]|uniref:Deazaflavin-dependent oxidoreductase (Nitroreductase family) n=1 Tax=Spelaeicoccus albus TaxID=1280376 RepID=A0A7Z0AAZ9_9MICO|nr:nitroreductase/quinone reductase family protein [Spelaeicoccus albus]NYI66888.1 deazaflavin-dependent oxidoreductase (nitroreductase family) [Spelaeicoccus albus]
MTEFNDRIIEEFRARNGRVDSAGFGSNLILLHTRGSRTGLERVNPALSLKDGDGWLVVASAKGAARDPAWAVNLRAHPQATIEAPIDGEIHTISVRAEELAGEEYEPAFSRFVKRSAAFTTYRQRAGRRLPVIRLTPHTHTERSAQLPAPGGIAAEDPQRDITVRRPGTDESLPHYGVVGDNYTMLLGREDTDGRYALIDMHVPPGGGPPPHRHDFEEMFFVLEGRIDVTFRGETTTISAGEVVNIPARSPHFFHNSSQADARMLCMVSPPGLDEYFSQWGQPLPSRTSVPTLSPAEMEATLDSAIQLGPRYAIENLPTD